MNLFVLSKCVYRLENVYMAVGHSFWAWFMCYWLFWTDIAMESNGYELYIWCFTLWFHEIDGDNNWKCCIYFQRYLINSLAEKAGTFVVHLKCKLKFRFIWLACNIRTIFYGVMRIKVNQICEYRIPISAATNFHLGHGQFTHCHFISWLDKYLRLLFAWIEFRLLMFIDFNSNLNFVNCRWHICKNFDFCLWLVLYSTF